MIGCKDLVYEGSTHTQNLPYYPCLLRHRSKKGKFGDTGVFVDSSNSLSYHRKTLETVSTESLHL